MKSSFSLTWVSETSENICFFYFMIGFFPMSFVFAWNISLEWWEIFLLELEALNMYCSWPKEDQKINKGICHMNVLWILAIEKCFPKTAGQRLLTFLQIQRELLSFATFIRVCSNSKEVSNLSSQNTYPNLKTTCHIKLKFFLWTKLLENLLLAKYVLCLCIFRCNFNGKNVLSYDFFVWVLKHDAYRFSFFFFLTLTCYWTDWRKFFFF